MMKVADFFCGAGGFSEGFRQAGFEIVFAIDIWNQAVETFEANKCEFEDLQVLCDDVIRISNLPDNQFNSIVPDTEVIIGSPPCVAFSNSNKSGNGDKELGIKLLQAYIKIVIRKFTKKDSLLQYWVLENVPNVKNFLKDCYSAREFGIDSDFVLEVKNNPCSQVYNAKYFGAPTNRKRYLCGNFPLPIQTHDDDNVKTLGLVLNNLGSNEYTERLIRDPNNEGFYLNSEDLTDHFYQLYLADFEWKKAKRLKQDRGYMGIMAFPENLEKPARTVMATMSTSSREAMILKDEIGYRLPTVREAASIMGYPIDYKFFGSNVSNKYKLVGNSVPPKLSYAIAIAILQRENLPFSVNYHPIHFIDNNEFINLNGTIYDEKVEKRKNYKTKFKYHIPYLKIKSYRVELTNHHSEFESKKIKWKVEIHHSQGKKAKIFTPRLNYNNLLCNIENTQLALIKEEINFLKKKYKFSQRKFHDIYREPDYIRIRDKLNGPYELLNDIKLFVDSIKIADVLIDNQFPLKIYVGYYILKKVISNMS